MTLEEFIQIEKMTLDGFKAWWGVGIKANDADYPSQLDESEWIEQYLDWREDKSRYEESLREGRLDET